MIRYIVRRLLWGVVLLVAVIAITFVLFYLVPNVNPAVLRAGRNSSPKIISEISANLGLNKPVYTQFWVYLKRLVLHFDLGYSYYSGASVKSLMADRLPATLSLTFGAVVIWLAVGIPVGIISAIKRRSVLDRSAMGTALVFVSAPVYWLGLLVLFLFAADIGKFKIPFLHGAGSYVGLTTSPLHWFESLLMPWFVLAATSAAIYARLLRGSLIDVMGEDYIRTARAKGLPEHTVVMKHGVRSAITPLVTVLGLDIAILMGGAVLTETVFDIPGIGRLNYDAITHGDFPIIQGTIVLAAIFIILANIVVDIAYAYLDPRVRYT
ncbi:MAG: ABC transporter permease [Solirubrobacterales bacterium]|nr:ABC transporter permease [Solirubrobacterales bacterium]MBV9424678.1 ABC transporter permease [Solirubrobacterales bacterium]MBV9801416.1 ABC transporter permease [Solirubrobacterales bacterium]